MVDAQQLLAAHPAWMELDLDALRDNVATMRKLIGPRQQLIASTKANAYGHGAAQIAEALEAVRLTSTFSLATHFLIKSEKSLCGTGT